MKGLLRAFAVRAALRAALLQNWNSPKYEYSIKSYDTRKYIVYLRNVEFDVAESGSAITTVLGSPET
jgi:hypothetical protein